ncbi:MAG: biopolymer transporter ExbD [Candidatus Cloacimonas sp.]|jgi:biopolymer transport protein ExbD|nr:biopolymer transporter ExbD [Candidatus Cloacimonadota bacterium]
MAKIQGKTKPSTAIPNASMSDIAFLLLIFFMVSTVFVKERGLKVILPQGKSIEKIPRKTATTIYVDRSGVISIDDFMVEIPMVRDIMIRKLYDDFNTIASFRSDRDTDYGTMSDILNQLREANALRVSFEAKMKR